MLRVFFLLATNWGGTTILLITCTNQEKKRKKIPGGAGDGGWGVTPNTYPLQVLQRTFLLSCNLVVFPLYRSSSDTLEIKREGGGSHQITNKNNLFWSKYINMQDHGFKNELGLLFISLLKRLRLTWEGAPCPPLSAGRRSGCALDRPWSRRGRLRKYERRYRPCRDLLRPLLAGLALHSGRTAPSSRG